MIKGIERAGKRAVRAVLRRALPKALPAPDCVSPKAILVIRPDRRIGNLVMLTPLLDAIRGVWPAACLEVLTSIPEIFQGTFEGAGISWGRALRGRYDLVLDASHMHEFSLSSACAALATRAPLRVGHARGDADRFLNRRVEPAPAGTHETEIHLRLLRAVAPQGLAGGPAARLPAAESLRPRWTVSPDEATRAAERWLGLRADPAGSVALFLGGRGPKQWPVGRLLEVARALRARGLTPIFFGGPADDATPFREKGLLVAPPMPLREFAAMVALCPLAITPDCGPMHVAVALGVPTLAIFCASDPARYGYAHLPGQRVLGGMGADVTVAAVLAALDAPIPRHEPREACASW